MNPVERMKLSVELASLQETIDGLSSGSVESIKRFQISIRINEILERLGFKTEPDQESDSVSFLRNLASGKHDGDNFADVFKQLETSINDVIAQALDKSQDVLSVSLEAIKRWAMIEEKADKA